MNWKNWPYWLRGGLIAISILIIFALVLIFTFLGECGDMGCAAVYIVVLAAAAVIPAFLIGALFGWIYGKNKI